MNALALHNVCLSFADGDERVHALDHVSLTIAAGELVAVSGASGSGKSSLLAVAGALRTPESGQVVIGDSDITAASPRERAAIRRRDLGFVFQQSNLFEALTSTDQLLYQAQLAGIPRATARVTAAELLAAVGISDKADRRPGQLSGGERQRVGIARALINSPRVILADEPTSALDAARAREIVQLLRDQTHQRQVATVMVTHDRDILAEADRVVTIRDGRIVDNGAP
ncbi:MAG: ABC transporter ATP-binding protein [Microthrixaceae bacterium]|nr:ABC transporter ATP-binding protein [Microthrixaceae bacterium]MCB0987576.1 ABC transporter ATP-binding protein [Acidimicrobiales bacterium]